MLNGKGNFERPLVFDHKVFTKTLGACKASEIQASIDRSLELWERGIHAGLVGDVLVEGLVSYQDVHFFYTRSYLSSLRS